MKPQAANLNPRSERLALLAAGVIIAAIGAAGFAAWGAHGGAMFMTLVENGIAWCF